MKYVAQGGSLALGLSLMDVQISQTDAVDGLVRDFGVQLDMGGYLLPYFIMVLILHGSW